MQAQKQMCASQLWQQGLNDVTLRSCDIIALKTLPLIVQCKIFSLMSAQARNYSYEKVCVSDRNLMELFLVYIFLYSDQKYLCFWTLFRQWWCNQLWPFLEPKFRTLPIIFHGAFVRKMSTTKSCCLFFAKIFIMDAWLGSKCASDNYYC